MIGGDTVTEYGTAGGGRDETAPHAAIGVTGLLAERYRVDRRIGSGGMADIYAATHVGIDKVVAIKVLSQDLAARPDIVRRFVAEARTMSKIHHPNVVEVFDFGETSTGAPFFVMEYLQGQDLSGLLRQERALTWERAYPLLRQICAGLAAAHEQGVVHRDMKPSNCFVVTDAQGVESIKLLDFGIAKALDQAYDEAAPTETGAMLGTAGYMAPEQAMGVAVDRRTDVYAVGVMAYQLLTGELPLRGQGALATVSLHMSSQAPPMSEVSDQKFPRALERLVAKAMAKAPASRFASAAALGEALDRVGPTLAAGRTRRRVWAGAAAVALAGLGLAIPALVVAPEASPPGTLAAAIEADRSPADPLLTAEDASPAVDGRRRMAMPGAESEVASPGDAAPPEGDASVGAPAQPLAADAPDAAGSAPAPMATKREGAPESRPSSNRRETRAPRDGVPPVAPVAPETPRDPTDIGERIDARSYAACYEKGGLPGMKVKLRVEVDRRGTVDARALPPLAGSPLAHCIESIAEAQRFPQASGAWGGVLNVRL